MRDRNQPTQCTSNLAQVLTCTMFLDGPIAAMKTPGHSKNRERTQFCQNGSSSRERSQRKTANEANSARLTAHGLEFVETNATNELSCPSRTPHPMKMESARVILGEVRSWV